MSLRRIAHLLLLLFVIVGCEKEIITEESTKGTENVANSTVDDAKKRDALTVREAQMVDDGTEICVKGYIVASTTRSMNNADFWAPFEGSTAIVLADEPVDEEDFQYNTNDLLMPICLTDYKAVRAALNLEDNPQHWNHLIYIYGTKEQYMRTAGLKKVKSYEFAS